MTLDKFNTQSLALFFSRHQKQLHFVVVVLLSLYLLAFAARLVWQIIPEPDTAAIPAGLSSGPQLVQRGQGGVNLAQLQQLNLFGQPIQNESVVDEKPITDAPETKLKLTLTGVVVSSIKEEATAIIEHKGVQNVYGLGEKIERTNATLHQVHSDRVIIKNGIRKETLMLDGIDYDDANKQVARNEPPPPRRAGPPQRTNVGDAPQGKEVKIDQALVSQLRKKPGSFTDYIAISPAIEEGQLIGYKIKPGNNSALFESSGLKPGDVVIQINGLDLTDTQQSSAAMNALRQASTIELTLTRDGEYITVYLDMPEPDNA
ncbi:type II secretion system protein GspC [Alteromonas sp. C1M14]|uniref:type II secretion system protein GspC n=1 Tax=Alteromonas sp. C1M14 TaxID=2841567 RepID=UPI001C0A2D1E|nr:type II secretion system protein GspC [Alteromonas sp. C1M14]MBU2978314.1 type II secretion system protein GspC [Alteromonas sp. C1M14]